VSNLVAIFQAVLTISRLALMMTYGKIYVKGFKLDRNRLAKMTARYSGGDGDIDSYILVLIHHLNCDSYKYVGCAYKHEPDPRDGQRHLTLVIVLKQGMDKDELERRELKYPIDLSIAWALPHVLEGLDVWEHR
jgi:hypothetical protein